MMAFQEIRRRQGARPVGLVGVTVSWRRRSGVSAGGEASMGLSVNIATPIIDSLGWPRSGGRVDVAYDPETNQMRIAPGTEWAMGTRDSAGLVCVPLKHVRSDYRAAALVRHEVVDGAVILHLPVWCWEAGYLRARKARDQARGRAA